MKQQYGRTGMSLCERDEKLGRSILKQLLILLHFGLVSVNLFGHLAKLNVH